MGYNHLREAIRTFSHKRSKMHLYEALNGLIQQWQYQHYPCECYPAIAEILELN